MATNKILQIPKINRPQMNTNINNVSENSTGLRAVPKLTQRPNQNMQSRTNALSPTKIVLPVQPRTTNAQIITRITNPQVPTVQARSPQIITRLNNAPAMNNTRVQPPRVTSPQIPTTRVNTTQVPTTRVNTAQVPTTRVSSPQVPTARVSNPHVTTTHVPTTRVTTTHVPTTHVPTTHVPTTHVPTTHVPTTQVTTTHVPTTRANNTQVTNVQIPTTRGNTQVTPIRMNDIPPIMVTETTTVPRASSPRLQTLYQNDANPFATSPRIFAPFPTENTDIINNPEKPRVTSPKIPLPDGVSNLKIPEPMGSPRVTSPVNIPRSPVNVTVPVIATAPITTHVSVPQTRSPQVSNQMRAKVTKDVVLRPWQTAWSDRAYNVLLKNHGYIDTSRMGSGKTYIVLWLAKQFGFRLLVVCPPIMIDIWTTVAKEYGVTTIDVISYQGLRSQKNHQPKHGFLDRYDNVSVGGQRQTNFAPTKKYLDLVNEGIMLVCDEIHLIKNNSAQYKACSALIRPIITVGGISRFGLLSGTPFDKEEHAVNLLRLIGYIRAYRLYNYSRASKSLILEGIQELIDACRFINEEETNNVLSKISLVKNQMDHLCYMLYIKVIKASISGAMPAPTTINGTFDVKNGFYNISPDRAQRLRDAIKELEVVTKYNKKTGDIEMGTDSFGTLIPALRHIELAKAADMARVAMDILTENNTNKVIISVNYRETIDQLKGFLSFYNPLVLDGRVDAKGSARGDITRAFNFDPSKRVLIMNTTVGGVGISLHDTVGNSRRYMLLSPSYKLIELAQASHRIWRDGGMSDATVRMFYGNIEGTLETKILQSLAIKTPVLMETLEDDNKTDLVLPGHYENIYEVA